MHKDADSHRKEDTSEDVGHIKAQDVHDIADMGQVEELRDKAQQDGCECVIDHEIGECTTDHKPEDT